MIPAIVFSKDRACQLDALLMSIEAYAAGRFDPVYVLWTYSNPAYRVGYGLCAERHRDVIFLHEVNFREDTLALLEGKKLVCFFTDDDILTGPVDEGAEETLAWNRVLAFSLRLGRNTTYCYPLAREQVLPGLIVNGYLEHSTFTDDMQCWRWKEADGDFSYPFSLDGHVLRVADVKTAIQDHGFTNPNQLEDILAQRASIFFDRPLLASYQHSRLVGIPANRVNATHPNRFAEGWRTHAAAELNRRYLAGERIQEFDCTAVGAAHQEILFELA